MIRLFALILFCVSSLSSGLRADELPSADELLQAVVQANPQQVQSETILEDHAEFTWSKIQFSHGTLGNWNVYLKKSKLSSSPLPVVFAAAGIQTGLETLKIFDQKENSHVLVFEYAFNKDAKDIQLLASILQNAPKMQMQMALTLKWLAKQYYVDNHRINLLLVSFSTFISPFAIRLAQALGVEPYSTVFAFGGARIKTFLLPQLEKLPNQFSDQDLEKLKSAMDKFFDWMDPENHLLYLKGKFLIIRGTMDEIIPEASSMALINDVPEPKKIVVLETPHIDMTRLDVVAQTMSAVRNWYGDIQALRSN
jgi:hypothetical protein